jgi:hypothetical protein
MSIRLRRHGPPDSTFAVFAYLSGCSPVFEYGFGLNPSRFALVFPSQPNAACIPSVNRQPAT